MTITYGAGGGNALYDVSTISTFIPGLTDQYTSVVVTVVTSTDVYSVIDSKNNPYERWLHITANGMHVAIWRSNIVTPETNLTIYAKMQTSGLGWVYAQGIDCWLAPFHRVTTTGHVFGENGFYGANINEQIDVPRLGVLVMGWDKSQSHNHPYVGADVWTNRHFDPLYGDLAYQVFQPNTTISAGYTCNVQGSFWSCCLATFFEQPISYFTGTPTSGTAPLVVQFQEESSNTDWWEWNFGDDGNWLRGNSAAHRAPLKAYGSPGQYTVTLISKLKDLWADTQTRVNYITVSGGPPVPPPQTDPTGPFPPESRDSDPEMQGAPPIFGPLQFDVPFWELGDFPPVPPPQPESYEDFLTRLFVEIAMEQMLLVATIEGVDAPEQAIRTITEITNSLGQGQSTSRTTGDDARGEFSLLTEGFEYERSPSARDDVTIGAQAGSIWVEQDEERERPPTIWLCIQPDEGNAVWVECRIDPTFGLNGTF